MTALLSCNGEVVTTGDGPALTMFVATIRGVQAFRRTELGSPWMLGEVVLADFHISSLLIEPKSGLFFAGTHGAHGIFVSADAGQSWVSRSDGLDRRNVYTLAAQDVGGKVILYAGVEPASLYRSVDLGLTWQELEGVRQTPGSDLWTFPPPPHLAHVKNIAFHPDISDVLYCCIEQGALLRSVDGGGTWSEIESYMSPDDFFRNDNHRVLIKRSNPKQFFMCGGEGLYYTPDNGESWKHLTHRDFRIGYPDAMFIDPRDDEVLYMAGPTSPPRGWTGKRGADATVLRSVDGGLSWDDRSVGLDNPVIGNIEAMGLYHWGDQVMLMAGTATGEVYASDDAGAHWVCAARGLAPISKGGHYRWFVKETEREKIEAVMRAS